METKVPEQNKEQEHARWRVWSRGETAALPSRLAPNYFYIMTGSQEEDVQAILKPPFCHFPNHVFRLEMSIHYILSWQKTNLIRSYFVLSLVPSVSPKLVKIFFVIYRKPNTFTPCFYRVKDQSQLILRLGEANTG